MAPSADDKLVSLSRPRVGVSRCLLGDEVRYDGASRHLPWITDVLSEHCDLFPLCPEVEAGFGVPRPPIRLVHKQNTLSVQLVEAPGAECTAALSVAIERLLLQVQQMDGLILKSRSPSCGINDTPVFNDAGEQIGLGGGLFTRRCLEQNSDLVVVDEQALETEAGRVSFMVEILKSHHFPEA